MGQAVRTEKAVCEPLEGVLTKLLTLIADTRVRRYAGFRRADWSQSRGQKQKGNDGTIGVPVPLNFLGTKREEGKIPGKTLPKITQKIIGWKLG